MLHSLKTWAKSWMRGNWYPILLPHCRIRNDGLTVLDGEVARPLSQEFVAAPELCGEAKTIILSPHLDDAALSLGAWMLGQQCKPLLVVDVFSTVSWWRF